METLNHLVEKAVFATQRYHSILPEHNDTSGKRVLVVEDDPIIQKIHRKYLEKLGYTVDVASNGQEALSLYKPAYYEMVFLDGGLPDTTGFDLAKIMRKQEIPNRRQIIFMLSGFSHNEVAEKCMEADIDAFAIKPVSFEKLNTLIKSITIAGEQ
jgi:CheY-like chemotaxis protein